MKFIKMAPFAALLFCGCGADEEFTLSSGTYAISDFAVQDDGCMLGNMFIDGDIISVNVVENSISITFNPNPEPGDPVEVPSTGMISDNGFTTKTSKDLDTIPDTTCQDKWTKEVTGTITENDVFNVSYVFKDDKVSETGCNNLPYELPCTTTLTFSATKQN